MNPSTLIQSIREQAAKLSKTIVLPDSTDERVINAARILIDERIAHPILIGKEEEIRTR